MTACTTQYPSDTLFDGRKPTAESRFDSVKKLVPRGFYVLTEQGARLSIKTKIDADYWEAKFKLSDDQLTKRSGELLLITLDRNRYRDQSGKDIETIRILKRQLFWANFWKYTFMGLSVGLTGKLITQSL